MQCGGAPSGAPLITKGIVLSQKTTTTKYSRELPKCHPKLLREGELLLEEVVHLQGEGEEPHHQEQVALLEVEVLLSRKRRRRTKIRMEMWKK